jgi:hypothetical protein
VCVCVSMRWRWCVCVVLGAWCLLGTWWSSAAPSEPAWPRAMWRHRAQRLESVLLRSSESSHRCGTLADLNITVPRGGSGMVTLYNPELGSFMHLIAPQINWFSEGQDVVFRQIAREAPTRHTVAQHIVCSYRTVQGRFIPSVTLTGTEALCVQMAQV